MRMRECFYGQHAVPPTHANVLGVLSLILWSLILIISVKYLTLILRADNRGEGGILALATLVSDVLRRGKFLFLLGLFGAALLYADGMITPAISVMSAVEGLHIATPLFDPYVVPIAIVILVGLFCSNHVARPESARFSARSQCCGLWRLALLGFHQIVRAPEVLAAINPIHGFEFFMINGCTRFRGARRGFPGRHRWRSALRRYRSLWNHADSLDVVCYRAPGVNAELFRSGSASACRTRGCRKSLFPNGAFMGALPNGGARDRRRGYCIASDHQRRLFAHDAGDPARLHARA